MYCISLLNLNIHESSNLTIMNMKSELTHESNKIQRKRVVCTVSCANEIEDRSFIENKSNRKQD